MKNVGRRENICVEVWPCERQSSYKTIRPQSVHWLLPAYFGDVGAFYGSHK